MSIQQALEKLLQHEDLQFEEMGTVMTAIMSGDATAAQIAGFLIALRMKGETTTEIAAAASVMRSLAVKVSVNAEPLIDTCGTGGDGKGIFNVSTACAFVLAAAGGKVAKHGNRSATSSSGSADVLEAAGAKLDLKPHQVAQCVSEIGVGFMFAPAHHGATRYAVGPRKELAVRTIFNVLGPLTNPAGATRQLIGVFDPRWVPKLAEVLLKLNSERAMIVCGDDGMDEISLTGPTHVAELRDGIVHTYQICPEDFGISSTGVDALKVTSPAASLALIKAGFASEVEDANALIALNAGAALYVGGLANSLATGVTLAKHTMASGGALAKLEEFAHFTETIGGSS
ncbi:MAG: anthranilate phosphoribosyltransferase [Pseudomonadota bacterium]